jgi:aminoglycoside phosphotransferase family enzyme/predicted kinase
MSAHLPPLITALLAGRGFSAGIGKVDLVETHASWVLLADGYAYKIKKPVTLPFLDYGTLERREACCRAELALNRRLAPELYLDVVPIGGSDAAPALGALPAIEWAVRMRRFDEAGRLDHVAARGELRPEHLGQLATGLAAFHAAAPAAAAGSRFGEPEQVIAAARENFVELRSLLPAADQPALEALASWTETEFGRRRELLALRKRNGCIREGHGDLHLGNLVLFDGRVHAFDCIEFSDDFRWNDPVSELAFLWIDLLDHGAPGLAAWLLNAWLEAGGDFDAIPLLRYYAVYRAVVRAKIAALRAGQEDAAQSAAGIDAARGYLALARDIAAADPHGGIPGTQGASMPALEITCGLSGSGKSTASSARLLDPRRPGAGRLIRLRSDVERKRLFGLAPLAASGSAPDGGIYTPEANTRTYARLLELAGALLRAGWPVIVDAAFLRRAERDAFRRLAGELGTGFGIVYCRATPDELRRRVAARRGDASEATLEVLERQLSWFEEPADAELELLSPA